jgi:hypothetical protein
MRVAALLTGLLAMLFGVGSAPAQEAEEDVALAAFEAVQEHCTTLRSDDVGLASDALVTVGLVWKRVDGAYGEQPEDWLLYWRGVLAHCLGQQDPARSDLAAFVAASSADPELAPQIRDARRRLRLLDRGSPDRLAARRPRPRARSAPTPEVETIADLRDRGLYARVGGGGATVSRLTASGSTPELSWTAGGELGALLPTKAERLGLQLGVSYANLPVSGCSHRQTRGQTAAVHFGPRIQLTTGKAVLALGLGGHVGLGGTSPTAWTREECNAEALVSDDPVLYGVRVADGDARARLSYPQLGWDGVYLAPGADAELSVGVRIGPGVQLGGALFVRFDQLVPFIGSETYQFVGEGSTSSALTSATVDAAQAAMSRFQFGLRASLLLGPGR